MAISSASLVEYTTTCWARNAVKSAKNANTSSKTMAHCWSVHHDSNSPSSLAPATPERLEPIVPSLCKFTGLSGNVLNTASTLGMPTTSSPLQPVIRNPYTRTLYSVSGWSPVRWYVHTGPRYTWKQYTTVQHAASKWLQCHNNLQEKIIPSTYIWCVMVTTRRATQNTHHVNLWLPAS